MPRSDSSGSSRKRRSTSRPTSGEKKSYGNKSSRPSRFDKGDDQSKPRFKRPLDDGDNKRPFNRAGKKFASDKPSGFKKRDDHSGKGFKRSGGDRDERRSSGPRDKKIDSGRSSGFKRSDDRGEKRPFGDRDKKFNDRASGFKRRDDRSDDRGEKRSFGDRDKKFSDRSSGFKRRDEGGEKRPFGDRDKKFGDRSSGFKRSSSGNDQSPDRRRPRGGFTGGDGEQSSFEKRKVGGDRPRSKSPASKKIETEAPVQTDKVRLNKFIANSGVCSRREADELITMGLISVNGKTITELGYKVNPGDEVRYESKVLRSEKPVYVLMNKPKGYLTTTSDPQERNTVMHIIGNAIKERIYPVGRLDRNTTGLLVLTNDGDLADKLMHPSYNAKKIYKVELDRPLTKADFDRIVEGVPLEEGRAMIDDIAIISDDKKTVGLEIHIGWNRVVRRIFEALEYQVVKLDRSVYAGLDKKDLPRGHWRFLTNEEVVRLKHYTAAPKKKS